MFEFLHQEYQLIDKICLNVLSYSGQVLGYTFLFHFKLKVKMVASYNTKLFRGTSVTSVPAIRSL